ncbi:tripartite tricarboxylate transporter substrate binding protein [Cupriavidus sp. 2TAF22]|uniref:tripartite tricarboxylate transporter substrate binding protein n=1 Tax=unclassified Cupriavidus TaxID=2640874 RepID=UPI003F8E66E2
MYHPTLSKRIATAMLSLAGLAGMAGAAAAADAARFPSQTIRLIVPFAPGGGNDILARAIAPGMSKLLGQQVIVDNRPGAGGNLGTELAARATDGHTLVLASNQITINPAIGNKTPFNVERDFAPVGMIASVPILLVVNPNEPYKTLQEFLQYARTHPGKLSYSTPGVGTPQHLAGELFTFLTKTDLLHAPYKGTSPAISDVVAGQVPTSFATMASVLTFIQAKKLRPLGIAGKQRAPGLPDLPTFEEAGLKNYDAALWYCMLAPAGMPRANVDKLSAALVQTVKSLRADGSLAKQGFEPTSSTPDELKAILARDATRWANLVKATGLKVEL